MQVKTLLYKKEESWFDELPVDLDSSQTLILVFGASSYSENFFAIQELVQKFPQSKIVGCSTAGEILGETVHDESLSVAFVKFEKTEINITNSAVSDASQSFEAGKKLANDLNRDNLRGVLILSDGLNVNGTELVSGINSVLPSTISVTGGLAGDGANFEKTWIIADGVPHSNFVSAVGFYGDNIKIGHGSKGGLDIFGIERKVTKSYKNQLFELDGKPALQLYKEYLGDKASELPASALFFPLSMRSNLGEEKRIVRTILKVNEDHQSMIFAGDVPQGSLVQLMRANIDRVIDGAADAANMAAEKFESSDEVLAIAISCVGRRLILGERAEDELEAVKDNLPAGTKQIGFYSYGEISPFASGYCDLHNQTMTLTIISEG